jgi:hypothetical protein
MHPVIKHRITHLRVVDGMRILNYSIKLARFFHFVKERRRIFNRKRSMHSGHATNPHGRKQPSTQDLILSISYLVVTVSL